MGLRQNSKINYKAKFILENLFLVGVNIGKNKRKKGGILFLFLVYYYCVCNSFFVVR